MTGHDVLDIAAARSVAGPHRARTGGLFDDHGEDRDNLTEWATPRAARGMNFRTLP